MWHFDYDSSWYPLCSNFWSTYLFTYLQSNTLPPGPVCASEMQCRTFCQRVFKTFLLKTKYHLQCIPFSTEMWGVFFLWEVKALIKASWKSFMIEMEAGWLEGKKKPALRRVDSGKDWSGECFSSFLTVTQIKKGNLYRNAILTACNASNSFYFIL